MSGYASDQPNYSDAYVFRHARQIQVCQILTRLYALGN